MPTFHTMLSFERDYKRLTPQQHAQFAECLRKFVSDLQDMEAGRQHSVRTRLRVKRVQGMEGIYEISWAPNGRALFSWDEEQVPGKRHIIWTRIGGHEILP